ncbi:MAG: hypothetical protein ACJAUH_000288 [Saprospiraceae bacterium]|jgi:hypothetical protein
MLKLIIRLSMKSKALETQVTPTLFYFFQLTFQCVFSNKVGKVYRRVYSMGN